MKFELEKFHHNIPDKELLDDIRRVANKLDKNSLTGREQNEHGQFHSNTMILRFGSWFNALEKAGLQKTRTSANIPEEDLFKNLEEIWIKLGRQPRFIEAKSPLSKYSSGTYARRFGSWRKALEKFVAYINKEDVASEKGIKNLVIEPATKHITQRGVNWQLRFLVMRRDNFKCKTDGWSPATGTGRTLEVDHIIPWSKGGETVMQNLQTLCSICNSGKSNLE